MSNSDLIKAAKETLGASLEKRRAREAKVRAPNQIAPSKYLPNVPRAAHADGGPAMFQGIHPDLQDEGGAPLDLYHGTPKNQEFEAFDDAKLGARDAGFYGRGHYLTPSRGNAEGYADPEEMGSGTVIGPLHAALKNPYVWDVSDQGAHRTLRDLQSMGIMRDKNELRPWDNLQQHHINPFMSEMKKRGHDGVILKTENGLSEVVAFDPKTIKHKDAEAFDPNDPRIRREDGGEVDGDGGSNVTNFTVARVGRDMASTDHSTEAQNLFDAVAARHKAGQDALDQAHAAGAFDNVKMGDVYRYKATKNATPMEVVSHRMVPVDRWGDRNPPTKVFNGHYPAAELKYKMAGGDKALYPIEMLESGEKYERIAGKPRLVKAGGGEVDGQNEGDANATAPTYPTARPQAGELPGSGGVRGGTGLLQAPHEASLEGLPSKVRIPLTGETISAGADPRIRQVARDYMAKAGLPYHPPTKYAKVDPKRAARIGDAYDAMTDNADDPLTKASYAAMIKETMGQYQAAKDAGFKAEFWNPEKDQDPYAASPRLATEDVRKNHHMWVYPTHAGYGSGDPISEEDIKKNPMLQLTGETWNGIPVTVNDIFRAVHDYYGHAKEGVGFRHDGEENAWRAHASMFSPLARMAMTTETRGQNSWLNFGPHGEKNRTARTEDTIFAPQKVGILPHWAHHEGADDFMTPESKQEMRRVRSRFDPNVGKALGLTRSFTKDGKSAILSLKSSGE